MRRKCGSLPWLNTDTGPKRPNRRWTADAKGQQRVGRLNCTPKMDFRELQGQAAEAAEAAEELFPTFNAQVRFGLRSPPGICRTACRKLMPVRSLPATASVKLEWPLVVSHGLPKHGPGSARARVPSHPPHTTHTPSPIPI